MEKEESINGKGMTTFNFRAEVWWRVEHASSITVVYFSSHLCKPAHEILQVTWSASFLLLVQAQKHLPLLLQMKNKYLTGGRHKRTTIWMTFSSLKCNQMLKNPQNNLSFPCKVLTQKASQWRWHKYHKIL